jgi:hypothetical protein
VGPRRSQVGTPPRVRGVLGFGGGGHKPEPELIRSKANVMMFRDNQSESGTDDGVLFLAPSLE